MVTAVDHRDAGTAARVGAIILIPLALAGAAVYVVDRYVTSLGIPSDLIWIFIFPVLFMVLGPVLVYWSGLHYRRAASMARIEAEGIPVWARFEAFKGANWHHGHKHSGRVYYLHFTVHPPAGSPHRAVAEDHLRQPQADAMNGSWVPLLLDPEDPTLAAVNWEALMSSTAIQQ